MIDLAERLQAALPERYTLEGEIGRRGMATVFRARERHPNRLVLRFAFDRSPMGVDRRVLESALFDRMREDRAAAEQLAQMTATVWERVRADAVPVEGG